MIYNMMGFYQTVFIIDNHISSALSFRSLQCSHGITNGIVQNPHAPCATGLEALESKHGSSMACDIFGAREWPWHDIPEICGVLQRFHAKNQQQLLSSVWGIERGA